MVKLLLHRYKYRYLLAIISIGLCATLLAINYVQKYEVSVHGLIKLLEVYSKIESLGLEDTEEEEYYDEEKDDFEDEEEEEEELIKVFENPSGSHVSSCQCEQEYLLKTKNIYQQEMERQINWLNLTTLEHLVKHHPNFPTSIMSDLMESKCHLIPYPHRIAWSNKYWQKVQVEDTTFFLYSAIIDNRPSIDNRPIVRIIAQSKSVAPKIPWCHLWFNASGPPVVSNIKIEYTHRLRKKSTIQNPYILKCQVPPEEAYRKPLAISVVEKPCMKADNLLEVTGAMERNITTAYREGKPPSNNDSLSGYNAVACGTALYYYHDDVSFRLVEWFEILRAIGFAKVFLHETNVHPNIKKVLQHYEEDGFVGVTRHSYTEPVVNEPSIVRLWRLIEFNDSITHDVVFFTDCVLRHMHEYRFIAHLDPDEVPMMLQHDSYLSWMDDTLKKETAKSGKGKQPRVCSYRLKWRYHYNDLPPSDANKDLPEYLWDLRHSKVKSGHTNSKCLYDMDVVSSVLSHRVFECANGTRKSAGVPGSDAYIGHFKYNCGKRCGKAGEVTFLLQFKDQIEKAVTKVLQKLKLI